jgi:hypothetical protein
MNKQDGTTEEIELWGYRSSFGICIWIPLSIYLANQTHGFLPTGWRRTVITSPWWEFWEGDKVINKQFDNKE